MSNTGDVAGLSRERQLQMVIDSMPVALLLVDGTGRLTACNTAAARTLTGISGRTPRTGDHADHILPGDVRFAESAAVQNAFAGATASLVVCTTMPNDGEGWYELTFWPAVVEDDGVHTIGILLHDVSHLHRTAPAIPGNGDGHRRDLLPDGLHPPAADPSTHVIPLLIADGGVITHAGQSDGSQPVSAVSELLGLDIFQAEQGFGPVFDGDDGQSYVILDRKGRQYGIRYGATPDADGFAGVAVDITAMMRYRQGLSLDARHRGLTTLARGLAHDLGNILTALIGNATMLRGTLPEAGEQREMVDEMLGASWRADAIVRQLVTFADGYPLAAPPAPVDLNALVDETVRLVGGFVDSRIVLEFLPDRSVPRVLGEAAPLRELLSIIISNAADAGCGSQRVRIMTEPFRPLPGGRDTIQLPSRWSPNPSVALVVADDGGGMGEEMLEAIFDPYFSTKFSGRGLGLSTALGIVKAFGGMMHVRSAPGAGTTITVLLPSAL